MGGTMTLYNFFLFCLCSHALLMSHSLGRSNTTADESVLFSFKSIMSQGSSGLLASWNISTHYCSWPGVVCGRRHPDRVVSLRMGSFNLSGCISPFLGNLSFLRELDLGDNHLVGQIPPELGRLARLRLLNLGVNSLEGNIPAALVRCTNLTMLDLSSNHLQGEIPSEIGSTLKNLASLNLSKNDLSGHIPWSLAELPSIQLLSMFLNRLSGNIPPGLANISNLRHLLVDDNSLSGAIPSSLGMLPKLSRLSIGFNNLTGVIPNSIWNISSLVLLSVQRNMLSGTIPLNAFSNLHSLEVISMDTNQFHGHLPASIANASNMSFVQLSDNSFSGIVPPEVGRLPNLYWLDLTLNFLLAKEPQDWEFVTVLTNCTQLQLLGLAGNKFEGVLLDSLSNLSTSLVELGHEANRISGGIPRGIGNLINLQVLTLNTNYFTGTLPSSLSRLKILSILDISENKISGSIPLSIGNLTALLSVDFKMNAFTGRLPNTLGNLTNLLTLDLSSNNFTGPIPTGLFSIVTLSGYFYLSHNNLEGSIPQELGYLKNLVEFRADSNKLSGEIPTTIAGCQLLQLLNLHNNILNGSIPSVLGRMKGLQTLDLSSNNLSGQIPKSFADLTTLYHLNLSFNRLAGEVPIIGIFANSSAISIQGNEKLCGGVSYLHLPPCLLQFAKKHHKFPVVRMIIPLIGTLVVLLLIYKLLTWHKKRQEVLPSTTSVQGYPLISYTQLVRATDGFSASNLLGSGSFGSVYKGDLDGHAGESTYIVAVKVLKLQTPQASKSFTAECETLRNMRHRNLLKIITVCSSIDTSGNDFKAIVYDFMPNGSLEGWLHLDTSDQAEQKYLNLHQRVTILLDVAYALDYLHCHGPAPVVHCDVKSSNVLLDDDMVAHVGDFGLAKILNEGSSILQQSTSSMGFRGTVGYAAPEYGVGNMVSRHGDIYSYGILVLETFTGRRPTDSKLGQALGLREFVELCLCDSMVEVVDMRLSLDLEYGLKTANASAYKRTMDCLVSVLRLGMSCSEELPSNRKSTGDIVKELHAIKESLSTE